MELFILPVHSIPLSGIDISLVSWKFEKLDTEKDYNLKLW